MPTVARLRRSRPSGHQVRVETGRGGVQVWKGVTKFSDVTTQCCQEFFAKEFE